MGMNEWKEFTCKHCGKEVKYKKYLKPKIFCCKKCAVDSWYQSNREHHIKKATENSRNNNWYYGENKRRYEREVRRKPEIKAKNLIREQTRSLNEKLGVCEECKQKGKTEFHHKSYTPNVFIEVCRICHMRLHKELKSKIKEGKA